MRIDLTGQKFGRLIVISETAERSSRSVVWMCRCTCGKITYVRGTALRSNHTQSCGCLNIDLVTKHGKRNSSEYGIWYGMLNRCENPNNIMYYNYGGRGIKVCDSWHEFKNFYADMGNRPSVKHSIDRVDNNKGYELSNCKWSTQKEQMANFRGNVHISYKGEDLIMSEVAIREGVTKSAIAYRISHGIYKVIKNEE